MQHKHKLTTIGSKEIRGYAKNHLTITSHNLGNLATHRYRLSKPRTYITKTTHEKTLRRQRDVQKNAAMRLSRHQPPLAYPFGTRAAPK